MMKKELCMMAIGLLLAGCSADEEIANVRTSESNVIGFNVVSNNPQTKATIITSTTFINHPFEVFAFKGGEHYMGTAVRGVKIKYDQTAWIYDDPNDIYYWPHTAALDFYAISPSDVTFAGGWNISGGEQLLYYLLDDEYGSSNTTDYKNVDVMYAVATSQKKANLLNGVVPLHFKHTMSQVSFKAVKDRNQMDVKVKSMVLHNVPSSGSFKLPQNQDENGIWDVSSSFPADYTIGMDMEGQTYIDVNHTVTPVDLSGEKPMLFIPAPLREWNTTHSITVANTNGESYLAIECKIKVGTGPSAYYSAGGKDSFGFIYVPFSAEWEQGKHYIYTLHFGAGYDEHGNEHDIVPITFTATVDDWVDTPVDKNDF